MKEIYDINIQRMNNGAHFTFVSNILARAEADTAVKGKASELVSNFKVAVAAEDEALKISQKSLLTDDIAKADIDRDALYAGYKKAVEAFLAMPIADMAQAAKVLAQHIKDYKINTAGQLDKETGLLVNFITDLEDKYSAQVAKLGLTAFVTNLKEANERVRMLTLQRTNEKMGVTVGALKAARTSSDDAYRALVKMVNALALVYGEKDYTAFIDYANTEITHYKREVLNQKASAPSTSGSSAVDSGSSSTPSGGGSSSGTGSSSSGGSTSGGSSSSDGE
jgi:possible hemagglutinin protein hagB